MPIDTCVTIAYWHFKPSLQILVLSVPSSAVPKFEGEKLQQNHILNPLFKKGLETTCMN